VSQAWGFATASRRDTESEAREFDLNIERVLENWTVAHAPPPMRDLDRYRDEWQDSFRFTFIDPSDLSGAERAVWESLPRIFAARGGRPRHVTDVLVSETMRLMEDCYQEADRPGCSPPVS
jgi:hypothetical protein